MTQSVPSIYANYKHSSGSGHLNKRANTQLYDVEIQCYSKTIRPSGKLSEYLHYNKTNLDLVKYPADCISFIFCDKSSVVVCVTGYLTILILIYMHANYKRFCLKSRHKKLSLYLTINL